MRKNTLKEGFTLIELLFVISIIGILSGVVFQSLKSARSKARDAQRASEIRALKIALHDYYNDPNGGNGNYPEGPSPYPFSPSLDILVTRKYISKLPAEPLYPTYNNYLYIRRAIDLNNDMYGIRLFDETNNRYCKTGVNMPTGWWATTELCPF